MDTLSPSLSAWLRRSELTLDELVEAVNALLPELVPEQPKDTVRADLDARTVRYYCTRGLLPRPSAYTGGRARYEGAHLLRALLIKRMQAEHHGLKAIERSLTGLGDAEVLAALTAPGRSAAPGPLEAHPISAADAAPGAAPRIDGPASATPPTSQGGAPDVGTRPAAPPLPLSPGGSVTVPAALLKDPHLRAQLADSLEALASWLRSTTENTPG